MVTTVTTTIAIAASYPVDYMTALMTMSSALLAIAGIIIGFVVTREGDKESKWGKLVIATSTFSVIAGVLTMVYVLDWFNSPANVLHNDAIWGLLIQFLLVYLPLISIGLGSRKPKTDKTIHPPDNP